MAINLNKLIDSKYSVVRAYVLKDIKNGDFQKLIVKVDGEEIGELWFNPCINKSKKKKHTGGKPSYAKIYLKKLRELKETDIDPAICGYMVWLADNIQWSTGLLTKGRGKNLKPLRFDDLMKIFKLSRRSTALKINEMKKFNLISYDSEGYRINKEFIMKGGAYK
jgi:hypothetical protein